jgi:hypothetical protein
MASAPGEQVRGRYAMFDELAAGGMGTVHLGRLLGPVGFARIVALKRLHPHLAKDPEFLAMFLDEARLASRIRHPNVVSMLDVVVEDGTVFLVMEYVAGESLSRLMLAARGRGERVPVPIAASILSGVLHGLHAAHDARDEQGRALGLVHRDVSPQNVMVGADGVPRVLDFGIAHAAARSHTTKDGSLKGKIAYMAPEQVRGEPVDRRADVFAAAVVLWELLVGRRLFQGGNEARLIEEVCRKPIASPSATIDGITPELDEVVMHGLARDPAQRFQSARAMAVALENAVALATARQVGEWVETLAPDTLAERAARVAAVEGASVRLPSGGEGDRVSQLPTVVPVKLLPQEPDRTELSVAAARGQRSGREAGRSLFSWVLAVVAVAAAGVSLLGRRGQNTQTSAVRTEAVAPVSEPPPSAAPVGTTPSAPAAPVSASGSGIASANPVPKSPSRKTLAPPAINRRDNCVPPYVIEDGVKSYKPECVH